MGVEPPKWWETPKNHRKCSTILVLKPIVLGISDFKKPSAQKIHKNSGTFIRNHWGIWIFTGFGIQLRSLPPMDLPTETKQKLLQFYTSPYLDLGVPISESTVTRSISGSICQYFWQGGPIAPWSLPWWCQHIVEKAAEGISQHWSLSSSPEKSSQGRPRAFSK